jgi:hypothetical protein
MDRLLLHQYVRGFGSQMEVSTALASRRTASFSK